MEEEKRPIITVLKELRSQSEITGMWTNITDEDIEKADDTIQDPNEGMGDMDGLFGNAPSSPGKQGESRENNNHDSVTWTWRICTVRKFSKDYGFLGGGETSQGKQPQQYRTVL